jgi:hypothetical protein
VKDLKQSMVAGVTGAHGVNAHGLVVLVFLSQNVNVTIQFQLLGESSVWVNVEGIKSATSRWA